MICQNGRIEYSESDLQCAFVALLRRQNYAVEEKKKTNRVDETCKMCQVNIGSKKNEFVKCRQRRMNKPGKS